MFNKILIALDDSSCSKQAGQIGLGFAQKLGAKVVVGHVLQTPPAHLRLGLTRQEQESYAQTLLEPWQDLGRQMNVELQAEHLREEDVGWGIVQLAQQTGCDLIVMGTHGREGLRRVLLGSVAERVSRLSPIPLLLVRGDSKTEPVDGLFRHILAPVDGSESGQLAVQMADRLAVSLDADLRFVHVVPSILPLSDPFGMGAMAMLDYEQIETSLEQEGKTILEKAKANIKAAKVTTELVHSSYQREAQVIVEYAQQGNFDLIVMGTHGRTGLDRLLLGSVAEGVAHHAAVPVLLVRASPVAPVQTPSPAQATKR